MLLPSTSWLSWNNSHHYDQPRMKCIRDSFRLDKGKLSNIQLNDLHTTQNCIEVKRAKPTKRNKKGHLLDLSWFSL